jgi:UDP-N-acetylmuramoylalanine--D-glutamate ligase
LAAEIKRFPGHMAQNVIAAANIAFLFKISGNLILTAIKNFKGLDGRGEEIVCRSDRRPGVKFINDTCATMPDAAAAALKNFAPRAKGGKVILICGGTDKNLDFRQFAEILPEFSKLIILLPGTATEKIKKELLKLKKFPPVTEAKNMKTAVLTAFNKAGAGDTILLSPAAASFGLFKNEFDRGEQFKKCVMKLKT